MGLRGRDTIRKVRGGGFRLSLRQKLLWTEMRPPQIHVGAGASRSNWLEVGPCDGVSVRIRRNTRELSLSLSLPATPSPLPPHTLGHNKKVAVCKLGGGASPEPDHASALTLDF